MKSVLGCIAGFSALLLLGGCSGVAAQPSVIASGSASASASGTATASASAPAGVQVFTVQTAGIKLSIPDDFIILDKSKATDDGADAYWQEMATRTGQRAETLKSGMARYAGVAVDSTGTTISISKRSESMPSLAAIAKGVKGIKDSKVTEVDSGLGKGIRVSLRVGAGANYQEFLYAQGPTSVVGMNISSKEKASAVKVFDQALPTIQAL